MTNYTIVYQPCGTLVPHEAHSPSILEGVAAGQGSNMGCYSLWLLIMFSIRYSDALYYYPAFQAPLLKKKGSFLDVRTTVRTMEII